MRDDDPDDWDEDDPDGWDEDELEDEDGETAVLPCPACGVEIFEDAVRCPSCGEYVVRRLRAWEARPWWWVALGLLGIGAVIWLLVA